MSDPVTIYRAGSQVYLKVVADRYACGYVVVDVGHGVHESSHSWYHCPICKAIWLEETPEDVNSRYCEYPCETAVVIGVMIE